MKEKNFFKSQAKLSVNNLCFYSSKHQGGGHLKFKFCITRHCSCQLSCSHVVSGLWVMFGFTAPVLFEVYLKVLPRRVEDSLVSKLPQGGFEEERFVPKQTVTSEDIQVFPTPRATLSMQGLPASHSPSAVFQGKMKNCNKQLTHKLPFKQ